MVLSEDIKHGVDSDLDNQKSDYEISDCQKSDKVIYKKRQQHSAVVCNLLSDNLLSNYNLITSSVFLSTK